MIRSERVPLSSLTTLRVGGEARALVTAENESDVREALLAAQSEGLPWYPLGGGSNLLAPDEGYAGIVVKIALPRVSFAEDADGVVAVAEAGVSWDALVRDAALRGLWGIENLAGIPGTTGAAPVQNIGAYGAELADTLIWVEALDPESGEVKRFPKEACAFGYRDSTFKRAPGLVILRIALLLARESAPRLGYKDLAHAAHDGVSLSTPAEVGEAVRAIRARKFPDMAVEGTAGSFFKNPTVSRSEFEALRVRFPELPGYESAAGMKLSLAWILDHALSLKGHAVGNARLFEAQPLVIVTSEGATARDVDALARDVAARVKELTGIEIEREVRSMK